jgi:signal transduction histidine kinase
VSGRFFQARIIHKGLALVLIPFLLNVVWIGMLWNSVDQTAKLLELERKQTDLVEALNSVLVLFYNTQGALLTYDFEFLIRNRPFNEKDAAFHDKAKISFAELKETLRTLSVNDELSDSQRSFMAELRQLFEQEFSQLDSPELRPTPDQDPTAFRRLLLTRMRQFRAILHEGANRSAELLATVDNQKAELAKIRSDEKGLRESVNRTVIIGLGANLFLVVALAFFFLRDISSRVTLLVANAQRLPKRQPLNKIGGTDELSYLDQAMHQVARDLQQAFDHRQSVMQMVAHDLRSPLAASQISLDILSEFESKNLTESGNSQLEKMRANNRRLLALVNDLLTIDLIELGKLELNLAPSNVRQLAGDAVETLESLAQAKNIALVNQCTEQYVQVDADRIVQVLVNLITNAIKFSPGKSEIQVSSARNSGSIVISVSDQGCGMSEQECRQAFEKFYQSANNTKEEGFGLGLAICRLIIESHQGRIGVESVLGKGSRFWFSIAEAATADLTPSGKSSDD